MPTNRSGLRSVESGVVKRGIPQSRRRRERGEPCFRSLYFSTYTHSLLYSGRLLDWIVRVFQQPQEGRFSAVHHAVFMISTAVPCFALVILCDTGNSTAIRRIPDAYLPLYQEG